MDGLITAFFKPLVKHSIIDVDTEPCIIAVHDTSPYNHSSACHSVEAPSVEAPSVETPSVEAPSVETPSVETPSVKRVPLVHVCQREPTEETSHNRAPTMYLHTPLPHHVTTPTEGVGELCDWSVPASRPNPQPIQVHCSSNSLLPRYQERTPPVTSDLTLSIRVTKRRRKIAVDKTAYPQHSTNLHSDLWVHTYRPLTCNEVCGNADGCSSLYEWLTSHVQCCREEFEYEEEPTNAMLLCGPPGSGKTAAVYAVASQLGIRVHEVNCSSLRDKGNLLSALKEATLSHQVVGVAIATYSVILIEEADVVFPVDRGFWSTIEDLLHTTKRPFILTSHEDWLPLDTPHTSITFTRPPKEDLSLHLQALSLCHNVNLSSEAANQIAESLNCDIRQAFNYLQLWLCWSPSNLPMLPSNSPRPPTQYDTLCDVDILNPDARVSGWWCVTPRDSLCEDASEEQACEGVQSVWADLTARTHSRYVCTLTSSRVCDEWAERVSLSQPHYRVLSRVAMVTDVLPMIRVMCNTELQRKATNTKRRFTHYLKHTDIINSDLMKPPTLSSHGVLF